MPSSKPARQPLAENLVGMPACVSRAVTRTPRFAVLKILELRVSTQKHVSANTPSEVGEKRSATIGLLSPFNWNKLAFDVQ
jgi:hypothetical protein